MSKTFEKSQMSESFDVPAGCSKEERMFARTLSGHSSSKWVKGVTLDFFQHTKGWLCYAHLFQQTQDLRSWKAADIRMSKLNF